MNNYIYIYTCVYICIHELYITHMHIVSLVCLLSCNIIYSSPRACSSSPPASSRHPRSPPRGEGVRNGVLEHRLYTYTYIYIYIYIYVHSDNINTNDNTNTISTNDNTAIHPIPVLTLWISEGLTQA